MKTKIILASGSPRRKELLKLVVPEFEIKVSDIEEILIDGLTPYQQAARLSYIKAKDIFDKTQGNRIVIGSDTMVVKNGKIYGKPKDKEDAKNMIKELLQGDRSHEVITGLSVLIEINGEYKDDKTYDVAKVYFKEMSYEEIEKWIDTGKYSDKAGAYALQEEFGVFVEKIEGNYNTVVGLPIHRLYDLIKNEID